MALSVFTRSLKRMVGGTADPSPGLDAQPPAPLFPVPDGRVPVAEHAASPVREPAPITAGVQVPAPTLPTAEPRPTVIVRPLGALANRMIQHMTAMKIASLVPGARISRIHLPEWGIDEPDLPNIPEPRAQYEQMFVDVEGAAAILRQDSASSVAITGYAQHIGNLLEPGAYRHLFRSDIDVESYGTDTLVINIRSAEIITGQYPPYVLVPIAFYRQIVRETGLKPVFFGQLSDCPYMDELRETFPDATFRHGVSVIHDWEVLRRSKNICMSVSTFSWAACWLSDADRVFMPLTGLLNPVHGALLEGGHNLVPVDDNRFLFYIFPINLAVPQDRYRDTHKAMEGRWRLVSGAWVTNMLAHRRQLQRSLADYLTVFDEEYYIRIHAELAMAKQHGWIASGRSHYEMHGFSETRQPCDIDPQYGIRYPEAGEAVSNGDYIDLLHFHAARGRHLGYSLSPS